MDDDDFSDHKLSGYLFAVLSLKPPTRTPPIPTPCRIVSDGFQTQCGILLSVVGSISSSLSREATDASGGEVLEKTPTKCEGSGRKRTRRVGMVNGSMSVVHQLHTLVAHNCLRIDSRVVRVELGGSNDEARVVVLVDVYLSHEALSGGQFRRDGAVVGAVFKHLSCDWELRSLYLNREYLEAAHSYGVSAWEIPGCHVLGCKLHNDVPSPSKRRTFDLYEIFKSLPGVAKAGEHDSSQIIPVDDCFGSGIWLLSDDMLLKILSELGPADLVRIAATCHHLRSLDVSIMPCMKLKLYPHQQAAIEWMLRRERNSEVLSHPFYTKFSTEDGFTYYGNTVSGEIVTGDAPAVKDFRGGLFCDEPGLGKTITALSLVLKTQWALADPPDGVQVIWCTNNGKRCGYYELNDNNGSASDTLGKRVACQNASRRLSFVKAPQSSLEYAPSKRMKLEAPDVENSGSNGSCPGRGAKTPVNGCSESESAESSSRCTRRLSRVKKNLQFDETWVQCDACDKWRRLKVSNLADDNAAWFCSMNTDPKYQSCSVPEEPWDVHQPITYLPGFCTKGTPGGSDSNVSVFINVLRENHALINSATRKALLWLAKLPQAKLSEMETVGLRGPLVDSSILPKQGYHDMFQAFGLKMSYKRGIIKWFYPPHLENLAFDVDALRIALREPLNSVRFYLSRATLVVVPANLVDHWKTQIEKHVRPGQLRVFVWIDNKKPAAHVLAWDYDVVITTFSRLSAEWGVRTKSALMQVHWLRVILDEGHTLGSSVALTNKFQMAVSLTASNRWILTGTPTPNTPSSQLSHLQPMLKFLHEEFYGWNQKTWEDGVLRPFELEMEEGRLRLLHLLRRCMISARKEDLRTIPPCIKKMTYLKFTQEHAKSYNELVVTVRRNILMADWNDPSHVESLLNPKQWKFRSTTIRNVRLSCCVAGHIKVTDAGQDIEDTMNILVADGLEPASLEYASIRYSLSFGGNCLRCSEWCRLPMVTPCRHLLCLDCVALSSEQCTVLGCGNRYKMQTPLTRPENPNPKWPVPQDLIELQPSYKQDDWDPDWQSTSSSKVSYLVDRLRALQEHNRKVGNVVNEGFDACHNGSADKFTEKVIIFSQFLEHIHVIEQQLTIAGINFAGMYSPMHSGKKVKSLAKFQHDANCLCLLMDGSAALGLDLSFVTHVFLMEPIWDRSMEEQVISRAHRMGASRPIHVETLAMRGTIEEQMLKFLQDADGCRRSLKAENGIPEEESSRAHKSLHDFAQNSYLSHLTSVRPASKI